MEIKRSLLKLAVSVLLLSATFVSCKKESDEPVYDHYINSEVRLQLTKEYISGLVDILAATYPEVTDIKALISSDVTVYKIIYKTEVDGQQVNASGLVCVPDGQGEYPVLSFQNGTNTLNASAPSENPDDYYYQMIELLASIGYVVVIPDYPGFGKSSAPSVKEFDYTFDNLANVIEKFTEKAGLEKDRTLLRHRVAVDSFWSATSAGGLRVAVRRRAS